ncbi:MAG: LysR family transcriptional regulator [Pseudomonadota bacterium]
MSNDDIDVVERMLDLDLLRAFVAVAAARSVTQAAAAVGRTQSAVSMQVRRLEDILGTPLIERTGHGVRLTPTGDRTLRHARRLLNLHDEIIAELRGNGPMGTVRFGLPDDYAAPFIPPLIGTFTARYTQIALKITCAPTPELQNELETGRIDVALLTFPRSPTTSFVRLEPLVWVAGQALALEPSEPLPIALSHPDSIDRKAALSALDLHGRPYRVVCESGAATTLKAVVRSNLAVAVLARCSAPKDLRILTKADGLPDLPAVEISVATGLAIEPPARLLADHITALLPALT